MQRISRRSFLKTAGVSLATASLAACGEPTVSEPTVVSSVETEVKEDGREQAGNVYVEGLPIVEKPVTYNIMNTKTASDKSKSQNDKEIVKLATADTNITMNWTETSEASYGDAYKLMLATGDGLPDAFFSTTPSDNDLASNPEDLFLLDEETLAKFAPNIYNGMEENVATGVDALKQADGTIAGLPAGVWSEYANWSTAVPFIRKDWLADVGMEMPKTVEDLYNALVAFKENCKGDNGEAITPMIICQNNWSAKLQYIFGSWGIAGRNLNNDQWFGRVENGKYSMNITHQRFKDCLIEMHKWHKAGLMNIDGFSMSSSEYQSLLNGKAYGLVGNWAPTVTDWDDGKWAALPVLTAPGYEGQELKPGENGMRSANMHTFTITSACKDPLGLLRWWDNCHSSVEWKRIGRDGPEGNAWELAPDGTTAYVKAVDPLPGECSNDTEYHNTFAWRPCSPILFTGESAVPNPEKTSEDAIRYEICDMYLPYFSPELVPNTPIPAEAAEAFAFTKEEIETAVENFMAGAVMNGFTDEEWDSYVANLESVGLQEWIDFYQHYLDRDWA